MSARVIIPIFRSYLSKDEAFSLNSIRDAFGSETICFAAPETLDLVHLMKSGEGLEYFDCTFFEGISGYNRLLTTSAFYERFTKSTHILICQLDCLVFRDELKYWVLKEYDYIAAPWFKKFMADTSEGLWRAGNGGFSLRNVKSHLRVLNQKIIRNSIYPMYGSSPWEPTDAVDELGLYQRIVPWYRHLNPFSKWTTIEDELHRYPRNEDLFWALEAPKFDRSFRVASAEVALPFAFEMAPRWCYEKNGRKLPFGCHAWMRYDREFWEEIIKSRGMSNN